MIILHVPEYMWTPTLSKGGRDVADTILDEYTQNEQGQNTTEKQIAAGGSTIKEKLTNIMLLIMLVGYGVAIFFGLAKAEAEQADGVRTGNTAEQTSCGKR